MKIALSCDHRGVRLYEGLAQQVKSMGHDLTAVPRCTGNSCDYPDLAWAVAKAVAESHADRGILLCGSGIGMCTAANKVHGIRAALVQDDLGAEMSRRHNDANVLCLPADLLSDRQVEAIVQLWLNTPFEGGRHARRLRKIAAIEAGKDPTAITE